MYQTIIFSPFPSFFSAFPPPFLWMHPKLVFPLRILGPLQSRCTAFLRLSHLFLRFGSPAKKPWFRKERSSSPAFFFPRTLRPEFHHSAPRPILIRSLTTFYLVPQPFSRTQTASFQMLSYLAFFCANR